MNRESVLTLSDVVIDEQDLLWEKNIMSQTREDRCLTVKGICEGIPVNVLIDTGSVVSIVSEELYERIVKESNVPELPVRKMYFTMANSKKSSPITKQTYLNVEICNKRFEIAFFVMKGLTRDIIIGMDFMTEMRVVIYVKEREIDIQGSHCSEGKVKVQKSHDVNVVNFENSAVGNEEIRLKLDQCDTINSEQKSELEKLLQLNKVVFSDVVKPIANFKFKIELFDQSYFKCKNYPVPKSQVVEVRSLIHEMVRLGVIEKQQTAYINPLVVVRKKDNSLRICVDARQLNQRTIPFRDTPPKVDEILSNFNGARYFSSLDLRSSYWQIEISEESRKYTGFLFEGCTYTFCRVPFGLKNSGAILIHCLESIFGGELKNTTVIYVDDVVLFTSTFEEHMVRLEQIFKRCVDNNIKLNLNKCDFAKHCVKFMGYEVNMNGVRMLPEKVEMIQRLLPPKDIKQLRRLLGVYNYYARFCPNFAFVIQPMLKLLRKDVKWEWDVKCQEAFMQLKTMFLNSCMINHPDFNKTIFVQTDSSKGGIGVVLFQRMMNGEEGIIAIGSRVLREAETRYSTTEREALAIVWACQKFRMYLEGRTFVVITDHKALTFLLKAHLNNDRLKRWVLWLQQFSFKIEYSPGEKNIVPDYFSRLATNKFNEEEEMQVNIINIIEEDPKLNFTEVRKLQMQDPIMKSVK